MTHTTHLIWIMHSAPQAGEVRPSIECDLSVSVFMRKHAQATIVRASCTLSLPVDTTRYRHLYRETHYPSRASRQTSHQSHLQRKTCDADDAPSRPLLVVFLNTIHTLAFGLSLRVESQTKSKTTPTPVCNLSCTSHIQITADLIHHTDQSWADASISQRWTWNYIYYMNDYI